MPSTPMNTDANQMLRRLVGLRLLMNRPLTGSDPPISLDSGSAAPGAPYNPWTSEDQLKQLVAQRLLGGPPPSAGDFPAAQSVQAPITGAVPSPMATTQSAPAVGTAEPANAQTPASRFK